MSDTTHAEAPGGSEPPRTSETSDAVTNGRKVVEYALSPRSVWMVIGAILLTLIGVEILDRTRNLISMLIIAFFFALAIIPLVERIHARRGWKRGAAVGVIFGLFALFLIVMVVFLIPMIVDVAQTIGANLSTWVDNLNQWAQDTFGRSLTDTSGAASAGQSAAGAAEDWASEALGGFLGALSTGIGLIFSTMTIALFRPSLTRLLTPGPTFLILMTFSDAPAADTNRPLDRSREIPANIVVPTRAMPAMEVRSDFAI